MTSPADRLRAEAERHGDHRDLLGWHLFDEANRLEFLSQKSEGRERLAGASRPDSRARVGAESHGDHTTTPV